MQADAEHLLVGAMLLDADVRATVAKRGITQYVFHEGMLGTIVGEMQALDEVGYPVDVVTLARSLDRHETPVDVETLTTLQVLTLNRGKVENAPQYADIVIEDARSRQAWVAAARVIERIRANPDAIDVQVELAEALRDLAPRHDEPKGGWYADLIPGYLDHLQETWDGTAVPQYVPTGIRRLDTMTRGGFHNGELIIVGARPGLGKTVAGLHFAHEAARQGRRVAFFSAEMTARAMLRRAGSEWSGVPAAMIDYAGHLQDERQQRMRASYVTRMQEELSQLPVYIDDRSRPTVASMHATIERLGDIGFVVFDYLSLAGETNKSEEQRISGISRDLMHLAKDFDVPVVALCQLNRAVETSKPYIPTLAHLRDSGQIEANAHIVLLLYRRQYYVHQGMLEDDGGGDWMRIFLSKNREGETGSVRVKFDGPTFSLAEDTIE